MALNLQLTIIFVRSVWVAVDWTWNSMSSPAGVSNSQMNVKLHIHVNILLFYNKQRNSKKKTLSISER